MSYRNRSKGSNYGLMRKAKWVQDHRSDHAKAIDRSMKAPKAKNIEEWLSAPNRYDLPNVDTNKKQQ